MANHRTSLLPTQEHPFDGADANPKASVADLLRGGIEHSSCWGKPLQESMAMHAADILDLLSAVHMLQDPLPFTETVQRVSTFTQNMLRIVPALQARIDEVQGEDEPESKQKERTSAEWQVRPTGISEREKQAWMHLRDIRSTLYDVRHSIDSFWFLIRELCSEEFDGSMREYSSSGDNEVHEVLQKISCIDRYLENLSEWLREGREPASGVHAAAPTTARAAS